MFQNISRDFEEQNQNEDVEFNNKRTIKESIKNIFTKKNIILYIICFMVSLVSLQNRELAPFGIAIFVAALSNCIPVGVITILVGVASYIGIGAGGFLNFILSALLIIVSMLIFPPKYEEEGNEKRRLGVRIFISTLLVQASSLFFKEILIYDILSCFMFAITAFIFYKIFTNALTVITNMGEKRAYSIEEVIGASMLAAIAVSCLSGITIFGYSIRNILCILIVLVMGWKNGILVGGTTGIVVGTVMGILCGGEPILLASYAISGMVAGILNKFGKIGVVVGFILGNVALTYIANGNTVSIIMWQEILIACLGLLAIPKNIHIHIEEIMPNIKLLPVAGNNHLEENKATIFKLNSMSESILDIANSYKEAAATIVDEKELKKQEESNFKIFEKDFIASLEGLEENILFDELYAPEDDILEDVFEFLLNKEKIGKRDLFTILQNHNNYIIGMENDTLEENMEEDIREILKRMNDSYKVSKINFIWKRKLEENKQVVSTQLEEVSKAIGKLAQDMEEPLEEVSLEMQKEERQKVEMKKLLAQKEIIIKDITIKTEASGKKTVSLYTDTCENVEEPTCNIKKMARILSSVLDEKMILQKEECALRLKKETCAFHFMSEDKLRLQIGVAKATKSGSPMSGDTSIQTKLADGKYLVAISDGMGSRKRSKKK